MHKGRTRFVVIQTCALLAAISCSFITLGSGDVITETRRVSNFNSIVLKGQGVVIVRQEGSESLMIESNANILERVEAQVVDATLELGLAEGVNIISNSQLTYYVSVDDLSGLTVVGSGEMQADRIETDYLEVTSSGSGGIQIFTLAAGEVRARISGSGEIQLAGNAGVQNITMNGSGKYLAGEVCSGSVILSVNGDGDATVCATETLNSSLTNGGSANYYGHPSVINSEDSTAQPRSLDGK